MAVEGALVVPVPLADNLVRLVRWIAEPTARRGLPPHVTVVGPFLDPADLDVARQDELARAVRSVPAFSYRLSRVGWFDDRVVYLAPEPGDRFVQLTEAVVGCFPDHLPYGGAYRSVVPHMSIAIGRPRPVLKVAATLVASRLPIDAVAWKVLLLSHVPGRRRWHIAMAFQLG